MCASDDGPDGRADLVRFRPEGWGHPSQLDVFAGELRQAGVVIGVYVDRVGLKGRLVTVDEFGSLWFLKAGKPSDLVSWAVFYGLRVYGSRVQLVCAVRRGDVLGLLHRLAVRVGVPLDSEGDEPYLNVRQEWPPLRPEAGPDVRPLADVEPEGSCFLQDEPALEWSQAQVSASWRALVNAGLASSAPWFAPWFVPYVPMSLGDEDS